MPYITSAKAAASNKRLAAVHISGLSCELGCQGWLNRLHDADKANRNVRWNWTPGASTA